MNDPNHITKGRGVMTAIFGVSLSWITFLIGVYLTYAEPFRHRVAGGAFTFESIACVAYLAALATAIRYNCWKAFRGHVSLWVSLAIVSLAFGAAGYVIEQSVYLNAHDSEKSEGDILFAVAVIVGLAAALISSLSILGNRFLNAPTSVGPEK